MANKPTGIPSQNLTSVFQIHPVDTQPMPQILAEIWVGGIRRGNYRNKRVSE